MAEASRPNIVVFWGDDIGISNLSCYSDGMMGYHTPNIDRLAARMRQLMGSAPRRWGPTRPRAFHAYQPWGAAGPSRGSKGIRPHVTAARRLTRSASTVLVTSVRSVADVVRSASHTSNALG